MLADPRARRAYLLTKAAVLVLALAVTPLLARSIGARAWWAFAAFAFVLGVITLAVLAAGRSPGVPAAETEEIEETEDESLPDPDQAIVLPLEDAIDLHPFSPSDVPSVVDEYLAQAHAHGFVEVRLIHGRGIGVQRERVRALLARHPLVASFHDAPAERGGWGATIAHLVPPRPHAT